MKSAGIPDPAVAYLRVSDKKQLNTAIDIDPDGNSIATQRNVVERRADALPARIVKEFVEPGVSAQSIEKRAVFQEMLAYLQEHPEIKYVIVYARSRAFRNYIDAAVTKRQLDMMGVKLISAREDFGDGIYADMMAAITDIFNDTQNKLSGQDISIKMPLRARTGLGTVRLEPPFSLRPFDFGISEPPLGDLFESGPSMTPATDKTPPRRLRGRAAGPTRCL